MQLTGLNTTLGILGFSAENIQFSEVTVWFVDLQSVKSKHMGWEEEERGLGFSFLFCKVLRIAQVTVVSCCTMDHWKIHGRMETVMTAVVSHHCEQLFLGILHYFSFTADILALIFYFKSNK